MVELQTIMDAASSPVGIASDGANSAHSLSAQVGWVGCSLIGAGGGISLGGSRAVRLQDLNITDASASGAGGGIALS